MNKKTLIIGSIVMLLDQIIKYIVIANISLNQSIQVIKNFFYLTYVENTGAAWSILSNHVSILILISLFALLLIMYYMPTFKQNKRNLLAFGLLIGGIGGNLIDRLFFGYVKDFLGFKIFNYDFPIFNVSDIAIFLGIVLLIFAVIKGEDHELNSQRKLK